VAADKSLSKGAGRRAAPGFAVKHWAIMSIEVERQINIFLATHHVMSLATVGSSGPHAASLFYACDGLALIWVSEIDTQHSREIEADPRVAATVAPNYSDFATIRGVASGVCPNGRISAAAGPRRTNRQYQGLWP
jgi:uncharacterized protein YhbP (UPF0306 family)